MIIPSSKTSQLFKIHKTKTFKQQALICSTAYPCTPDTLREAFKKYSQFSYLHYCIIRFFEPQYIQVRRDILLMLLLFWFKEMNIKYESFNRIFLEGFQISTKGSWDLIIVLELQGMGHVLMPYVSFTKLGLNKSDSSI